MTYYKARACPGCGKFFSMPPQSICEGCEKLLATATNITARETRRITEGERVIVRLGTDWRFLGPKFTSVTLPSSFDNDPADRIAEAIAAISGGIKHSVFSPYQRSVAAPRSSHSGLLWVEVTPEQADAMQELCDALHDYCLALAQNVAKREHSFLLRIAEGDITVNQINEHAMKVREA